MNACYLYGTDDILSLVEEGARNFAGFATSVPAVAERTKADREGFESFVTCAATNPMTSFPRLDTSAYLRRKDAWDDNYICSDACRNLLSCGNVCIAGNHSNQEPWRAASLDIRLQQDTYCH